MASKWKADSEIKSCTRWRTNASCTFRRWSEKLVELGIQPREPFTICKAERKEGNRWFIEWQVKKDNDSNERPPSAVSHLEQALASSIDAAIAAEQYAATKGFSVRFGSEHLRAMALSLFIQGAREGGLR
jgi:hypothetical protein